MRFAYADPPYPGRSRRYYFGHPDYAGEVDHAALIERLDEYDGWALSTAENALQKVLALCPPDVRIGAWVRGCRPVDSWQPLRAWEPVIYRGGRLVDPTTWTGPPRTDVLVHGVTPMTTLPDRVIGAKPPAFCRWVFQLLGAAPGDTLADVFPGSGAVGRAWAAYTVGASPDHPSRAARGDTST